jgi:uridine phosphorylase
MPQKYSKAEIKEREQIADTLINEPSPGLKAVQPVPGEPAALAMLPKDAKIPFPTGTAPKPKALNKVPLADASLADTVGQVDVVVVTYTQAEADALAHVLTPGVKWSDWYAYSHNYTKQFRKLVGPRGPSHNHNRLAQMYKTQVGKKNVLVMKSDLHLHTDVKIVNGKPTLPIQDLYSQIIDEAQPETFLTIGTAGGVYPDMLLGDTVVTRGAKFLFFSAFKNEPFNNKSYQSNWKIAADDMDAAITIMQQFRSMLTGSAPPDVHCTPEPNVKPAVYFDGQKKIPAFHPILTTDIFEFGTTVNRLDKKGMAVEMDDAVLAMVAKGKGAKAPNWAVVRNLSDPIINGDLPLQQQKKCAVFYYSNYGAWTSVMGALATWAIIRGLK